MRAFCILEGQMPDPTPEVTPSPAPVATPPAKEESFSPQYVRELRHENAGYRLKAQEATKALEEAKAAADKTAKDAEARVKDAETRATERILRAELKAAALKAGMVDLDGLKLADLSKVKLNDAGEVEGADELMAGLKESKPYLFGATGSTSSTDKPPKKPDPGKPKRYDDMTPEERKAEAQRLGITVNLE
jgi:hypothetical protein